MDKTKRFIKLKPIGSKTLVLEAHFVKTFGVDTYINSLDGNFIEKRGLDTMDVKKIYPIIHKAYRTNKVFCQKI